MRPVPRIKTVADDSLTTPLKGQVHALARAEFDRGPAGRDLPMQRIVMLLRSSPEQELALDQLMAELHDPASPQFHHWLTPQEFGSRFGVADEDLQEIQKWLGKHGFNVESVAANRRMIEFSGTASQVASAFHTEVHQFEANGEVHYANASDPTIPQAFASVIGGFASLNNFRRRPMHRVLSNATTQTGSGPRLSSPQYNDAGGIHTLTPYDFATIYNIRPLWDKGIDGTGQSIAIVSRSSGYGPNDIGRFRMNFGLPYKDPIFIMNGPDPGRGDSGDQAEMAVDAEWVGAVAKNATIYMVISKSTNTTDGIDLSAMYAIDHNVAPVLEVSYGSCETYDPGGKFYGTLWKQAAAQGISVVVSSGDSGAAGCDDPDSTVSYSGFGVNAIASTPHNVAVGGTQFTDVGQESKYWAATNDTNSASALSYIPETTWNESSSGGLWATGGGVSTVYSTPSWQTGTGVPTEDPNGGGGHHRYLPDVSLTAADHDGYYTCLFDSCVYFDSTTNQYQHHVVSGTSVSAAAFAGVMALVNQQAGGAQGNPNFHLYPLSKVDGIYHDVSTGTNSVNCTSGTTGCVNSRLSGYAASAGFDLATGWGSMDVNSLVSNWSSVSFQPTTVTGTASPTTLQHGTNISLSASVSSSSGTPTGAISAYAVKNGATTALGAVDVATGTFTPSNKLPGGVSSLYFRYGGDGTYGSSVSNPITLTVTPEPSTVTSTTDTTGHIKLGQSYSLAFKLAGTSGVGTPTGTVNLYLGSNLAANGTVSSDGSAIVGSHYFPSGPGTYTFTAKYSGDESFAPSSTTVDLTFDKASAYAGVTCSNGNTDVLLNYPLDCQGSVTTTGVFRTPTGTMQFYDDNNPIGGPVALVNGYAKFTLNNLAAGAHHIAATYSGDSYFTAGNISSAQTFQVVTAGTLSMYVNVPGLHLLPGSASTVYVTVQAQQYGPNLTGKLTIYDGTTAIASEAAPSNNGRYMSFLISINITTNPWSLGTHTITAKYDSDAVWPTTTSASYDVVITNPDFWFPSIVPGSVTKGNKYIRYFNLENVGLEDGAVTYQCTGAPAQSTCTVDSNGRLYGQVSVTVTTTGSHYVTGQLRWWSLATAPFAAVLIGSAGGRRKKLAAGAALLLCLGLLLSCGGGGASRSASTSGPTTPPAVLDPGTPSGTYTLTVTATYQSGTTTITHSTPLQLTVQ